MADEVRQLGRELLEDPNRKANNAAALLGRLSAATPQAELRETIKALKLYFISVFHKHDLGAPEKADGRATDKAKATDVFEGWLRRQYLACQAKMLNLMTDPATPPVAQVEALMAIMEFVRGEKVGSFQNRLFTAMLCSMLKSPAFSSTFLGALSNKFFQFADVRFYSLQAVRKVARSVSSSEGTVAEEDEDSDADEPGPRGMDGEKPAMPASDVARNCFDLLSALPDSLAGPKASSLSVEQQMLLKALQGTGDEQPAEAKILSWCGAVEGKLVQAAGGRAESSKQRRKRKREEVPGSQSAQGVAEARQWANSRLQKKVFSEAWLAFLRMTLPADIYKKVLTKIHTSLITNISDPLLLSDFLTASLDRGGLLAILALNGIFLLVTKHGLEYPHFYRRLYGLLTADVFKAKHRVQFFKLVDAFLASTLVPAYTVASFAKRFARLALRTTPPGAMVAMGFIHNLIRRHPSCLVLLHRPGASASDGEESAGVDVFREECDDPAESRAIESSLWEVSTLASHYCPTVSQMATLLLEKDVTDRRKTSEMNIEMLTRESYSGLVSAELKKRLKRVPVAFYAQPPTKLFDTKCHQDFVGWSFA